jgi:acetyl esterase
MKRAVFSPERQMGGDMTDQLDAGARHVLEIGKAANARLFEAGTPEDARSAYDLGCPTLQGDRQAVVSVEDRRIDGAHGTIALRIYRGIGAPSQNGPGLLYLHGGGWVIGNLESHDEICRWFANLGQCTVVCPDYRLAPENKFPAALMDCTATLSFMGPVAQISASIPGGLRWRATVPAAILQPWWLFFRAWTMRRR